jgi:hypothetical protein
MREKNKRDDKPEYGYKNTRLTGENKEGIQATLIRDSTV